MPEPRLGPDRAADELIALYALAERRLRARLERALRSKALGTAAYQERQLRAVRAMLRALRSRGDARARATIEAVFTRTLRAVDVVTGISGAFGGATHRAAVNVLAHNLSRPLDQATRLVGRRVEDAFREPALREVGVGLVSGATREEVSKALQSRLVRERVTDATTGFVDRAGRRWSLESYTRMVARTTTREAVSQATMIRMQEHGLDLVTISDHGPTDELCEPYAGQTFSFQEDDAGEFMPPYHPSCMHVATPSSASFDDFASELGV